MRHHILIASLVAHAACTVGTPTEDVPADAPDETAAVLLPDLGYGGYDGKAVFQLPLATDLTGNVRFEVDAARASIEPRPRPVDVEDTPLATWALLTVRGEGPIDIVATVGDRRAAARIEITRYTPAEIERGRQRYFTPSDPQGAGRQSCASCHARPDGHDHSALNTMFYPDDQLLRAIRTGHYTDDESLVVEHELAILPEEERGIVGYIRSLPPRGF